MEARDFSRVRLHSTDTLYVLGDIIDRNPHGMLILNDIMKRKNIEFFIGNHELFMYYVLFGKTELPARHRIHTDEELNDIYEIWTHPANGGKITYASYAENYAGKKEEIKQFLLDSHVTKTIEIDKKKYHLSHTAYLNSTKNLLFKEMTLSGYDDPAFWEGPFKTLRRICKMTRPRKSVSKEDRTILYPLTEQEAGQFDPTYSTYMENADMTMPMSM